MKNYILILLMLVVCLQANAQITTTICPNGGGFKEFPMLYKVNNEDIPLYEMPVFNLDSVLQYEAKLDEKGVGRPYRFGYVFDTDYEIGHGRWKVFEDKSIWSIRFRSGMAYTLNFRFADLKLSGNAEMYVYNSNGTVVDGPYTYKNNTDEEFITIGSDLIDGEEVIIQIIEPKEAKQSSYVKIVKIVHGFRDHYKEVIPNKNKNKNKIGDSFQNDILDCHVDVICSPFWFEPESRGVARILINGAAWCSGALLNNKAGTNRPYFLTAHHCLDRDNNDVLSDFEKALADSIDFAFNYKKDVCGGSILDTVVYVRRYSGSYFRAGNWKTDFLLLELKDAVTDPNIRFLGWDAYPVPAPEMSSGFGLHHPKGNLMKVSLYLEDIWLWGTTIPWDDHPNWTPRNSHFFVSWDAGATEGGSSGSPLFDQNYRVRGQLHGGYGGCPGPLEYQFYGALTVSMRNGLYDWLVPYPTGSADIDYICDATRQCSSFTFENKTLTKDERIVCEHILLKNITINSGATLLLQATKSITLGPNVTVKTGGALITEGRLLINSTYTVEAGASVIVK